MRLIAGKFGGIALGVALSLASGALYLNGALDGLDRFGLDLHFRYLAHLPADPAIVLVDIDDRSLESLPRWPWPRRLYADLVRSLQELGCRSVVLDVLLDQPNAPRVESAAWSRNHDIDSEMIVLGDPSFDPPIFDDDELRDALSRGIAFLPMFARTNPPGADAGAVLDCAIEFVRDDPKLDAQHFHAACRVPPGPPADRLIVLALLVVWLEHDFSLDEDELIKRLCRDLPSAAELVREEFVGAKRIAAKRLARAYLQRESRASWPEFLSAILPDEPHDALSADREALLSAYRAESFRLAHLQSRMPMTPSLMDRIPRASDPVFPLEKFVTAGVGVGFAGVGSRDPDGVVRSVPMLVNLDETVMPQLGLMAVMSQLGTSATRLEGDPRHLLVKTLNWQRRIPIDDDGSTLIHWHVPPARDGVFDWRDSFVHLPAARPLEIAHNSRTIADNQRRLALARAELVEARHADTRADYASYVDLIRKRDRLVDDLKRAATYQTGKPISAELAPLESKIREMEKDALVWLDRAASLWRDQQPTDETESAQRERILRLHDWFHDDKLATRIAMSNRLLEDRSKALQAELLSVLGGKICLVGYTATGTADLVTTPIHLQAPGVIVHANIINMILQDQFVARVGRWWNVLFVVVAGCAAALAARRTGGWRVSLVMLLGLTALTLTFGAVVFYLTANHTAAVPASVALTIVWGGVTVHRQATDERARRRLYRALVQYTSPPIASRIAGNVEGDILSPQTAEVTCFFADLRGFTQLSARLGPARTRDLINPYLQNISRVLIENGAMVNKFVGDGVFAFFNAPILPCPNHAAAACKAALESLEALRRLSDVHSNDLQGNELSMRIGISTGNVFVGDYGSDLKLDYTCIGDVVNFGSRLEQANKSLGTTILLGAATQRAAGTEFVIRPIGRLMLAGRSEPMDAFTLLESPNQDTDAYFESLAAAIKAFQSGDWRVCRTNLARCEALRPHDAVVGHYVRSISLVENVPASPDWRGAIVIGTPTSDFC